MTQASTISQSAEALMAESRRLTGIDLVDHEALEPLTVLLNSLNEEGGLHKPGAIAKRQKLLRLLNNRLRMHRDFQAHPEIADQKIDAPLFVIGLARSGTTKTQKVLSATGDFNWLPFWQAYNPALFTGDRNEPIAPRIDEAMAYCRWFDEMSPQTKLGHAFEALEPEEDTTLTETCLVAPSFIGYAEVPSYLEWLGAQDPGLQFRFLRDTMKYLQWQGLADPSKKWLLKAPTYYGVEKQLLDVFPDAKLVMTHRSPLQTVPSSCKLITVFRLPFSSEPVNSIVLLEGFKTMIEAHIANRSDLNNLDILDVHFEEVSQTMDSVVEKIYRHIGSQPSAIALKNIRQWSAGNPIHKKGKFHYSLGEFGLTDALVRERMAAYIELMATLFD